MTRSAATALAIGALSAILIGCGNDDASNGQRKDAAVADGQTLADAGSEDSSAPTSDSAPDAFPDAVDAALTPLLGVNYTHFHGALSDNGIVRNYHQPGIRDLVKSHLAAMRENGATTTRLLIWHTGDVGTNDWGVIPYQHAQGALPEPYATNLKNYLGDVKSAGYTRITVAFGPAGPNDPKENYGATCDATFFDASLQSPYLEENWSFIQYVRGLVKQLGPADSRFDLLNEGAPYDWIDGNCSSGKSVKAQVQAYDKLIYERYVQAFGASDVTISVMASNLFTCAGGSADFEIGVLVGALDNVIGAFGAQPPAWFAVHPYFPDDPDCASIEDQSILASLMVIDNVLTTKGLSQPIVIQETYHDDPKVAAGVAKFMETSPRRVDELMEWPVTSDTTGVTVEPPYTLKNYLPLQKP